MSLAPKRLMPMIPSGASTPGAHKKTEEATCPPKETVSVHRLVDVLLFVGPSGSGKSTVISRLQQDWPTLFEFSVSHTTRAPRRGEVNGEHYHFVTTKEFQQLIDTGAMVEYSCMPFNSTSSTPSDDSTTPGLRRHLGNLYGTSKKALHTVLARNRVVLMDTDLRGAISMRCYCARGVMSPKRMNSFKTKRCVVQQGSGTTPSEQALPASSAPSISAVSLESERSVVSVGSTPPNGAASSSPSLGVGVVERALRCMVIFIAPPSMQALEKRLRERQSETNASLQSRMDVNQSWMQWAEENRPFFDHYIVNDDLELCYAQVKSIVQAEVLMRQSSL